MLLSAGVKHHAHRELPTINTPTLVIGGGADRIVGGAEVQQDIAAAIPNSRLHIYPELGRGAYAEAKDFGEQIYDFFKKE